MVVEVARARRGSAPARAPPRRASGGGAGASSRAPRSRRRARCRRPAAGPRCGGPARSRAPGRPTRRRTPTPPRATRRPAPPAARPPSSTRRMPRPPPPAAALTSSGKPIASASATIAATWSGRSTGAGSSVPGTAGDADRRARSAGHAACRRGRRSSPTAARRRRCRRLDGPGERRPLGQEAVARMDRLGAGRERGVDDRVDAQVALGRRVPVRAGPPVGQPDVLRVRRRRRCRRRPPPCPARGRPG